SGGVSFNDNSTFTTYPRGFTNKDNWRRDNVNIFIKRVNDTIKTIKPYVKFGVGPFGIWKNGVPSGITGLSSYDAIYCDPVTWLNEQNIDYVSPQLYWKIGTNQDFNTLADWWGTQANNNQRHCYAGMASYQLNPSGANWAINDILNQIKSTRLINYKVQGESFFSSTSIEDNMKNFADSLRLSQNKYKCLIPTMPWLDSIAPLPPANVLYTTTPTTINLNWQNPGLASDNDSVRYYVIYRNTTGSAVDITDAQQILYISPSPITSYIDTINIGSFPGVAYAITSCDKLHNESSVEYININITPPANDNCIASQTIIPDANCSPVSGNLMFSSGSGMAQPSCDGFANPSLQDVWYQFVATATEHTIKITPDGNMDAVLALYNSCNGSEIACADNSGTSAIDSLVASGLTIGNNYLLRVYDYGSIAPTTTTFNICIDGPNLSTAINKNEISTLELFPNPITDHKIYGKIKTDNTDVKISINNILSQKIMQANAIIENENFSIELPNEIKSGIYFINIEMNNSIITKKVMVQ
ncbi:MAG: family 10 glycosylhydrolase, partial [Bacteroidia bacterium]